MFRTSVKAAVAALAAGTALTACGPVKVGTAAVIGDDRITTVRLDAIVTEWRKELPSHPAAQQVAQQAQAQGQQVPFDPSSPQRSALAQLLAMRVWDEVARENSIDVTPGQIDSYLAQARLSGADIDANVLAMGLPTRYRQDFAREVLVRELLGRRYGLSAGQSDPGRVEQANEAVRRAARTLRIRVNPRYGSFDYTMVRMSPVCPRLSSPDSGTDGSAGEVKCQV